MPDRTTMPIRWSYALNAVIAKMLIKLSVEIELLNGSAFGDRAPRMRSLQGSRFRLAR